MWLGVGRLGVVWWLGVGLLRLRRPGLVVVVVVVEVQVALPLVTWEALPSLWNLCRRVGETRSRRSRTRRGRRPRTTRRRTKIQSSEGRRARRSDKIRRTATCAQTRTEPTA